MLNKKETEEDSAAVIAPIKSKNVGETFFITAATKKLKNEIFWRKKCLHDSTGGPKAVPGQLAASLHHTSSHGPAASQPADFSYKQISFFFYLPRFPRHVSLCLSNCSPEIHCWTHQKTHAQEKREKRKIHASFSLQLSVAILCYDSHVQGWSTVLSVYGTHYYYCCDYYYEWAHVFVTG